MKHKDNVVFLPDKNRFGAGCSCGWVDHILHDFWSDSYMSWRRHVRSVRGVPQRYRKVRVT